MSIDEWDEGTNHDYEERMSLGLLDKEDGCKGYSEVTQDGTEYECGYEFADVCDDCLFGGCGGTNDPRIDSSQLEIDDDCDNCKHEEVCKGGCESGQTVDCGYKFERKEEKV